MRLGRRHPDERYLALLAGEDLGPLRALLVRRHVARCPACAETVSSHRELRRQFRAEAGIPAADLGPLALRIRASARRLAPAATPSPAPSRAWRPVLAAAAVVVAVVSVGVLDRAPDWERGAGTPSPAGQEFWASSTADPHDLPSGQAQITARGALSVRSFDAGTGTLTITDYHLP